MKYVKLTALGILLSSSAILALSGCGSSSSSSSSSNPDSTPEPERVAKTPTAPDSYEGDLGDNNRTAASSITVGQLQDRTIYPADDIDWVAVELVAGATYEFSASNLEETGDSYIHLHDENGTELTSDDDFVDYDSNIEDYTAPYTGTYYVRVRTWGTGDLLSYQLGVREYVDADGDGYSPFYDVDDNNDSIHPWAVDIGGNGIDENCDGIDAIADNVADSYEDDDTLATAKPIPTTYGSMEEIQNRFDIQSQMRTIHAAGEVDFLEITIPPYSGGYVIDVGMGTLNEIAGQYSWEIQEADGTVFASDTGSGPWEWLENTTDTTVKYYLKVWATDGTSIGGYMPAYVSYGEDRDGDGVYTMESWDFDPDDNNASIPNT